MHQHERRIESPTGGLAYLLGLPRGYGADPATRWPLILFLHGRGERGTDLSQLKLHGIPKEVEQAGDFPFITIAPQCPPDTEWAPHNPTLIALLDEIMSTYSVDAQRIYLTGLSMGGRGTWQLAVEYPEHFAAIVPICGRIPPDLPDFFERLAALKNLPAWVFHGAMDPIVPIENSERIVAALRSHGSDVRYTVYPEIGHDSWTATYANPALYAWLLEQTRAGHIHKEAMDQPTLSPLAEEITIREYHDHDWEAICAVHDRARPDELRGSCDPRAFVPLAEEQAEELDNIRRSRKFVACAGEQIVGFVGVDGTYLSWLYVDPAYYGRGIGRRLLRLGIEHTGPQGWTIALAGNARAIRLYESEGFQIVETFEGDNAGYPCTCVKLGLNGTREA